MLLSPKSTEIPTTILEYNNADPDTVTRMPVSKNSVYTCARKISDLKKFSVTLNHRKTYN